MLVNYSQIAVPQNVTISKCPLPLETTIPLENNKEADQSPQPKINAIASEIEKRATSFYGLGYGLGKYLLGTIKEGDYKTENDNFLQKAVRWVTSLMGSSPVFAESMPQDQGICIAQKDSMKPQAVIIRGATIDIKSERTNFIPSLTEEETLSITHHASERLYNRERNIENHYVMNKLDGVKLSTEICEMMAKVNELGPIKFFILNAHGSPLTIELGQGNSENIDVQQYFSSKTNEAHVLSCLDTYLDDNAIVILESCDTANHYLFTSEKNKIENGNDMIPINMQIFIASLLPGRTIFAPDYAVWATSMEIDFEPSVKVVARGSDLRKHIKTKMHALSSIFEPESSSIKRFFAEFYELYEQRVALGKIFKEAVPYYVGNGTLPIKPFKVISPQHAPFCKEVLPYYSAKRYCDAAHLKPNNKKIKECENDAHCKKLKSRLVNILNDKADRDAVSDTAVCPPISLKF